MHGAQDSSSFILLHERSKVFKIIYTNCPGNVCPGKWLSGKRPLPVHNAGNTQHDHRSRSYPSTQSRTHCMTSLKTSLVVGWSTTSGTARRVSTWNSGNSPTSIALNDLRLSRISCKHRTKLQLDVCCISCCGGAIWWTLTKERQAWCYLQVKLCDPCLSALSVPWPKKAPYKYSSFPFLYHVHRSD